MALPSLKAYFTSHLVVRRANFNNWTGQDYKTAGIDFRDNTTGGNASTVLQIWNNLRA